MPDMNTWRPVAILNAPFPALDVDSLKLFIDSSGDHYALIGRNTGLIQVTDPEQFIRDQVAPLPESGPLLLGLPVDRVEIHDPGV